MASTKPEDRVKMPDRHRTVEKKHTETVVSLLQKTPDQQTDSEDELKDQKVGEPITNNPRSANLIEESRQFIPQEVRKQSQENVQLRKQAHEDVQFKKQQGQENEQLRKHIQIQQTMYLPPPAFMPPMRLSPTPVQQQVQPHQQSLFRPLPSVSIPQPSFRQHPFPIHPPNQQSSVNQPSPQRPPLYKLHIHDDINLLGHFLGHGIDEVKIRLSDMQKEMADSRDTLLQVQNQLLAMQKEMREMRKERREEIAEHSENIDDLRQELKAEMSKMGRIFKASSMSFEDTESNNRPPKRRRTPQGQINVVSLSEESSAEEAEVLRYRPVVAKSVK